MDVTARSESDPAAETLVQNLLRYVSAWKPTERRTAVYAGDPAGKQHLEAAGVSVGSDDGGRLTPNQVLVVGQGAGKKLSGQTSAIAHIAHWLQNLRFAKRRAVATLAA